VFGQHFARKGRTTMKKENILLLAAGFIILAYVLDYFAGPVSITVKNHLVFLAPAILSKFPLTAVAIGIRTLGLILANLLLFSLIKDKYFVKAIGLFCLAVVAELYAIQQLATGARMTPIQWTLSFGYFGILLVVFIVFYIVKGLFFTVKSKFNKNESPPIDSNP